MRILGIETSCDETAVAVVEASGGQAPALRVLDNLVASQVKVHAKYGGVVPEVAARGHVEAIFPMLARLLRPPGRTRKDRSIDLIAVTAGPGLAVALRVGVEVARTLSALLKVPVVGVNHLAGHVYSSFLNIKYPISNIKFPILALIVSGGHTELVLMRRHGQYQIIGETRDDAAGEAFDKVAKMLGLGYPGGPAVSKMAEKGRADAIRFPRPMIHSGDLDFSFSGLKTAVLYHLNNVFATPSNARGKQSWGLPRAMPSQPSGSPRPTLVGLAKTDFFNICASFQQAVVDVLVAKTVSAVKKYKPKTMVLCGGVAANGLLRKSIAQAISSLIPTPYCLFPPIEYTGDNAAMIAAAAYFEGRRDRWETLGVDPGWRLGEELRIMN